MVRTPTSLTVAEFLHEYKNAMPESFLRTIKTEEVYIIEYNTITDVSLKVYNTLGQEVATLVNETKPAGVHTVQFDAGSLASGVYFYRLQAAEFTNTKKLLLVH